MVGAIGYLIFIGLLAVLVAGWSVPFVEAQIVTTYVAMAANFFLNNTLTYRDRRLRGTLMGQPLPDGNALVQLRDAVVAELERYGEGAVAEDDITFVLCQFDPQGGQALAGPPATRSSGRGAA